MSSTKAQELELNFKKSSIDLIVHHLVSKRKTMSVDTVLGLQFILKGYLDQIDKQKINAVKSDVSVSQCFDPAKNKDSGEDGAQMVNAEKAKLVPAKRLSPAKTRIVVCSTLHCPSNGTKSACSISLRSATVKKNDPTGRQLR